MKFSIVHLSDIHLKDSNDTILQRIDELKAACASQLPNKGVVVIAISGDIAFSGKQEQYKLAEKVVSAIRGHIEDQKGSTTYVVTVPGNHDCDFSVSGSTREKLIDAPRLDQIDAEYYKQVSNVQDAYGSFAESYGIDHKLILPRVEISVGEKKVLFLLVNSAWMSSLKETPGKIIIPSRLFERFEAIKYKAVVCLQHHPVGWLNPDVKTEYIRWMRKNVDMLLLGHEHLEDKYRVSSESFSLFVNQGSELQESASSESAFSVINFDDAFQNFDLIDFIWRDDKYRETNNKENSFHKNICSMQSVFRPNAHTLSTANDFGTGIVHFAKDEITLSDLFVWPEFNKVRFGDDRSAVTRISEGALDEWNRNLLSIIVGNSYSGKTALAKKMFLINADDENCCLMLKGNDFTLGDDSRIKEAIEIAFVKQYSNSFLDDFRQLDKAKKTVIVDDFDIIRGKTDRKCQVLDYLCSNFGHVIIFLSSSIEITTLLPSASISGLEQITYFEILPLGNYKRRELIRRWYALGDRNYEDEEIDEIVNTAISRINTMLGSGHALIPAAPIYIIGFLQNTKATTQSYKGSQYGFLYESLILSNFNNANVSIHDAGEINVIFNVLSMLAFRMLSAKSLSFERKQFDDVVDCFARTKMIDISADIQLKKATDARIIDINEVSGGYRFKYPYIFYYFCGKYIASNLTNPEVKHWVTYMSSRLHIETYGNILIFACHTANKKEITDEILLNAMCTLENNKEFEFGKDNPIFDRISDSVNKLVPVAIAASSTDVEENVNKHLIEMDNSGVIDGHLEQQIDDIIDETDTDVDELAEVAASFKTMEVLGQVLQNYPAEINGEEKVEIITEIHKLGMRSVQTIIDAMGDFERYLIEYVLEHAQSRNKYVQKDEIINAAQKFISMLITGMARGMLHQIAVSLGNQLLVSAAENALKDNPAISAKLVYLDLKLNVLKKPEYKEIQSMKKSLMEEKSFLPREFLILWSELILTIMNVTMH